MQWQYLIKKTKQIHIGFGREEEGYSKFFRDLNLWSLSLMAQTISITQLQLTEILLIFSLFIENFF